MNPELFDKGAKLQGRIKVISEAIGLFRNNLGLSRVAVATNFRHYNNRLHELDLPVYLEKRLKDEVVEILQKEKDKLINEFNNL